MSVVSRGIDRLAVMLSIDRLAVVLSIDRFLPAGQAGVVMPSIVAIACRFAASYRALLRSPPCVILLPVSHSP